MSGDNLLLCHETGPWGWCFYTPSRHHLKVLVPEHVLESRSQVLGLQCTLVWSPNQTSLRFFDYIRNATRWPGTSLLRHWCSWNNMGNIVGTLTCASRAFYTAPRPQMRYDENVEVWRTLMPRFDHMFDKFCDFHCLVQWGQGERLFCDHNKACCLSYGLVWIRFDALSSAQFNHFGTRCADKCEYFFRNTQYDHMLFMWKLLGLV